MSDKVFITGSTGNIGSVITKNLAKENVSVTLYVRDVKKADKMFSEIEGNQNITYVEGDYTTLDKFEEGIKGHSRLFLLVHDLNNMPEIKGKFSEIAYNAGVKQIIDLSSFTVGQSRVGIISAAHTGGEERIRAVKPQSSSLVVLRPGYFMPNAFQNAREIKEHSILSSVSAPENKVNVISTEDIGDAASTILLDPIEKHGDIVYELTSQVMTNAEIAEAFTEALGRPIKYVQNDYNTAYERMVPFLGHKLAYDFLRIGTMSLDISTPYLTVLTKKPLRKYQDWIRENKNAFQ
ncbi:prestalk differentiation protein A [Acrasis kona]|uniref:Prestalk differentiation protein A n=1 Tax=Acrasis kona TaxID=1008807 RepID=A0AAW2Z5B5_9EUKA